MKAGCWTLPQDDAAKALAEAKAELEELRRRSSAAAASTAGHSGSGGSEQAADEAGVASNRQPCKRLRRLAGLVPIHVSLRVLSVMTCRGGNLVP